MFSKASKIDPETQSVTMPSAAAGRGQVTSRLSYISPNLTITGNLNSEGDIQVDGLVEGDITTGRLTVGAEGKVRGEIRADELKVLGTVHGEIQARRVNFASSAHVEGNVIHEELSIESGAFVEGHCRRMEITEDEAGLKLVARDEPSDP